LSSTELLPTCHSTKIGGFLDTSASKRAIICGLPRTDALVEHGDRHARKTRLELGLELARNTIYPAMRHPFRTSKTTDGDDLEPVCRSATFSRIIRRQILEPRCSVGALHFRHILRLRGLRLLDLSLRDLRLRDLRLSDGRGGAGQKHGQRQTFCQAGGGRSRRIIASCLPSIYLGTNRGGRIGGRGLR